MQIKYYDDRTKVGNNASWTAKRHLSTSKTKPIRIFMTQKDRVVNRKPDDTTFAVEKK